MGCAGAASGPIGRRAGAGDVSRRSRDLVLFLRCWRAPTAVPSQHGIPCRRATESPQAVVPRGMPLSRRASLIAAMCSGVEPQQPPIRSMPSLCRARACSAMSAGVASYSKWSPTTWGSPALDWATSSRPSGRASASCAAIAAISSGPRPQFAPTASTPASASAVTASPRTDAHHRAQVRVERQRGDHRQVGYDGPGGRHRRLDLAEVAHRLDQHHVDAAGAQPAQLLLEQLLRPPRRSSCRAARAARRSGRGRRRRARRARRRPPGRSTRRPR